MSVADPMTRADRILEVIRDELAEQAGTVERDGLTSISVIIKLDGRGEPRQVLFRTEGMRSVGRAVLAALAHG